MKIYWVLLFCGGVVFGQEETIPDTDTVDVDGASVFSWYELPSSPEAADIFTTFKEDLISFVENHNATRGQDATISQPKIDMPVYDTPLIERYKMPVISRDSVSIHYLKVYPAKKDE